MLGEAIGACVVFRLRNNVCQAKMASTDTAIWKNKEKIKISNVS